MRARERNSGREKEILIRARQAPELFHFAVAVSRILILIQFDLNVSFLVQSGVYTLTVLYSFNSVHQSL